MTRQKLLLTLAVGLALATTVVMAGQRSLFSVSPDVGNIEKQLNSKTERVEDAVVVSDDKTEADRLFEAGYFDAALPLYDAIINANTSNPMTYFRRAMIYFNKGRWAAMGADLDKAILLKKDFSEAYVYRAVFHEKEGRLAESIKSLEWAVKYKPNDFETLYKLGIKKVSFINQYIESHDYKVSADDIKRELPFAVNGGKDFEKLATMNSDYRENALTYCNYFKLIEKGELPYSNK